MIARVSQERAAVIFVDNAARAVYGQRYFSGKNVDQAVSGFISEVMSAIRATYHREAETAWRQGIKFPAADPTMRKIRNVIIEKRQAHDKEKCGRHPKKFRSTKDCDRMPPHSKEDELK